MKTNTKQWTPEMIDFFIGMVKPSILKYVTISEIKTYLSNEKMLDTDITSLENRLTVLKNLKNTIDKVNTEVIAIAMGNANNEY